ncbi:hypothetical protein CDD83_10152 [Cordyceps sp. RAO-2017]|nr:hypothetical protein CDD83_10152 [Cordyceps sp. RAO-2017]
MKEVDIDVHRLKPKSPAHRMYFLSKDIVHQALAAASAAGWGLAEIQWPGILLRCLSPLCASASLKRLLLKGLRWASRPAAARRGSRPPKSALAAACHGVLTPQPRAPDPLVGVDGGVLDRVAQVLQVDADLVRAAGDGHAPRSTPASSTAPMGGSYTQP